MTLPIVPLAPMTDPLDEAPVTAAATTVAGDQVASMIPDPRLIIGFQFLKWLPEGPDGIGRLNIQHIAKLGDGVQKVETSTGKIKLSAFASTVGAIRQARPDLEKHPTVLWEAKTGRNGRKTGGYKVTQYGTYVRNLSDAGSEAASDENPLGD